MDNKRKASLLRRYIYPFGIVPTFFKLRLVQPLVKRPFLPRCLVLYVTYHCNSQCIMCGIWKNHGSYPKLSELSPEELDKILSDQLFSKIESLNLNGGELALRSDLPEVVQTAVNRLPGLRKISMISNGIMTDQLLNQVEQIKQICVQKKIAFSISISVHGLYEVEDKIYGIKGAFDKQLKTIDALQEIASDGKLELGLSCVIMNDNVMNLRSLLQWCQARNLIIRFSIVEKRMRFNNSDMEDLWKIGSGNKDAVIEFFQDLSHDKGLFKPYAYVYDYLANLLQSNQVRTLSCDYILGAVILGSHGELYYCPHDDAIGNCRDNSAYDIFYDQHNLGHRRNSLIQLKCSHCPPKNIGQLSIQADVFKYLKYLIGWH